MICHFVLIRLQSTATDEQRAALLERARELLGSIEVVRNLRVGRGLGKKAEREHPYALVMDFENEEALEIYQKHPSHQRFVREVVDPIQDEKKVYDYWC